MHSSPLAAAEAGRPGRGYRRAAVTCFALVAAGVLAYALYFSWLAIARHDAFGTHTADLGQIDLAVWNTAFGRFVQEVKGETISTRLTDHLEPIFWPISTLFHVWDDVRVLLVSQAASLALAALPVFAFVALIDKRHRRLCLAAGTWAALAYLLAPQSQAATITDFHASPLAALPLVLLLVLGYRRRTWPALVMALACMAIKEEISLAVLMAGLYFATFRRWSVGWLIAGAATAWFCLATFVVIPHYANAEYGLSASPYLARYEESSPSAADASLPVRLARRAFDPARLRYVGELLLAFAGMPLLAPEVAAIALPLVGANYVSSYDAMYGGEFHYSAPFMAILAASAGLGALRLLRAVHSRRRPGVSVALMVVLAAVPLAYQAAEGFTPIGREYWLQRPAGGDHERLLGRFATQIPAAASLSTTPALHPHFSHRERIYTFPDLADAEYVLLDASGTTDMHPNDFRRAYEELLVQGYGIVDAADGYVLLHLGQAQAALPDEFYSFARAAGQPEHVTSIDFGASLRLVGYDWVDDPKWGHTRLRLYWQVLAPLDDGLQPYARLAGLAGQDLADTRAYPFVEPLWYPLSAWQPGETAVTSTVPMPLGDEFEAYVSVHLGSDPGDVAARLPVSGADGDAAALSALSWARLAPVRRQYSWRGASLMPVTGEECASRETLGTFGGVIDLVHANVRAEDDAAGGRAVVALTWRRVADAPEQLAVSLRLLDATGAPVAQADGSLHAGLYPVRDWPEGGCVADAHSVSAAAGSYAVAIVVYDRETLIPLPLADGRPHLVLSQVTLGGSP